MGDGIRREDAARQILADTTAITRWWLSDFKPGHVPGDLTWTQFAILSLAAIEPELNMSQIAGHLELSVPTVVRAVDALERKGLVVRVRPSMQRRHVTVKLTPAGEEAREIVERMRSRRLRELLARMSDEEVTGLLRGFSGMLRAVSPEHADGAAS